MRNLIALLLIVCLASCQTVKLKNDCYKVSDSRTELGSIGQASSFLNCSNTFSVRAFPKLENKIRLAVEVLPFNKKVDAIYRSKAEFNQNQANVTYIDSLPKKPEIVTFGIIDMVGLVKELNAVYNEEIFGLLSNNSETKIISSVAVVLPADIMAKISQADTYYLDNRDEKKYTILLYKQGKKTDTIDIGLSTVVGYQLSSFCWGLSDRGKWYLADLYEGKGKCKKPMLKKVTKKAKSKSLYDM